MLGYNAINIGSVVTLSSDFSYLEAYPTVTNFFGINTAIGFQIVDPALDGNSIGYVYKLLSGSQSTSAPTIIVPNDNANVYWSLQQSETFTPAVDISNINVLSWA